MKLNHSILNGPYLLSPSSSQITVVWDMEQLNDLKLVYAKFEKDEEHEEKLLAQIEHELEPACREYPNGCYIYTSVLKNLQANTKYKYQIFNEQYLLAEGEFHTLRIRPHKIRLITISDSHLMHTENEFSKAVEDVKPEFILHSGDISFGTGYQREQYVNNWFQKIPRILQNMPVYYIPGNHDDGYFYETFFAKPQAKTVNSCDGGFTYSFDYGNVHFLMVDSNSWGLFEMNAVNSGLKIDKKIQQKICNTLHWIDKDLKSKAALKAKWRVLISHHPYTDLFNNHYIVPIAEKNNVDLVITGHLHYYVKTISVDPKIGSKTVYVSQGSLQDPEAEELKTAKHTRLLRDFPEVVAIGKNNYGVLEIDKNSLQYNLYGFDKQHKVKLIDTIKMVHEEPLLEWHDVELKRLDNIGNIEVSAYIKNKGKNIAAACLELTDNDIKHKINLFGSKDNSHVVLLEPNEAQKISTVYQAIVPGKHIINVENVSKELLVYEPTQLSFKHMKIFVDKNVESDCISARIEATNNLDREVFVSVPLYINQRIAESKNIFFSGHEKKYIEFRYKFDRAGSYQVSIADQLPKEIQIQGGIRIVPKIHDKSGNGHYALLQGTPKVITNPNGSVKICFEHYGDYIEIPASKDLIVPNSFTGMVWANIKRLAKQNEMGHNPLMVRGKSVGWGATYLMRMVIERSGALKWGICHDITEYSWQGGQAEIGNTVQYTMSFDKKTGGNSYCNSKCVAHVDGIKKENNLRQWDDEPIFIGYAYIGHVIPEINRPKYYTHLSGSIEQVRFYKTALSELDNKKIYENPLEKGPQNNKLAVWLDFKDILSIGTHTTEWRHPAVYDPAYKSQKKYWQFKQLRVTAVLPMQASIKATIEVSDDKTIVKDDIKIVIKDGINYFDLSILPQAQYIRIITELYAEVGADGTFVPELKEYQVTAYNGIDFSNIFWSVRKDWEQGTFSGAAGFAPIDRLRDFPEYTDIIHG